MPQYQEMVTRHQHNVDLMIKRGIVDDETAEVVNNLQGPLMHSYVQQWLTDGLVQAGYVVNSLNDVTYLLERVGEIPDIKKEVLKVVEEIDERKSVGMLEGMAEKTVQTTLLLGYRLGIDPRTINETQIKRCTQELTDALQKSMSEYITRKS